MATLYTETMFRADTLAMAAQVIMQDDSMKAAKVYIYETIAAPAIRGGVIHRDHLLALFAVALNATRKQAFYDACEAVRADNVTQRIDYAVRLVGRNVATGELMEHVRADVATMPKAGDIIPAHDLMNSCYVEQVEVIEVTEGEAPEAEAFEIIIRGSVGVNNPFHKGDVVYVGAMDNLKATVSKMPKVGDVIEATGGLYNETNMVKVRQILNDYPQRPAHMEAAMNAHYLELFSGFFNDRVKPTPERKNQLEDMTHDQIYIEFAVAPAITVKSPARFPIVKRITDTSGARTFRITFANGKVYLFTEGNDYAQLKMPGGRLKDVTLATTLSKLREVVRKKA